MNVKTILSRISELNRSLNQNKVKETIEDYIQTFNANRQNIVVLKDLTERLIEYLDKIDETNINSLLESLLNTEETEPFTWTDFQKELRTIIETQPNVNNYFNQINQQITQLKTKYEDNLNEIENLKKAVSHLSGSGIEEEIEELEKAIISIIFNHESNTKVLKDFSKTVSKWSKILPLYHQLIKSSSPEDIEIYGIEMGSIDILLGIDPDVAKALMELFKAGLEVFTAYLVYKTTIKEIVKTAYRGNQKLIDSEKEREEELLKNIKEAIKDELKKQHEAALAADDKISIESVDVKIESIANVVEEHVVKGNDLKLIEAPKDDEEILNLDNEVQEKIRARETQLERLETTDWNLLLEAVMNEKEEK